MPEIVETPSLRAPPRPAAPAPELEAMRGLLQVQQEKDALALEAEKAKAIRVQMCEYLLTSGLAASRLPAPAAEQVRKQFAGQRLRAHRAQRRHR